MAENASNSWRVLLVDDDEDDYFITQTMLSNIVGRQVRLEWAGAYDAGLAAVKDARYDAIMVDYDLGARTGVEWIRAAAQAGTAAPIILYTGRGNFDVDVDVEAMSAGATINITKQGATPQLLERSILFAIQRKEADQALHRSEERWRLLADSMPTLVWTCDDAARATYLNRRWQEYTGRPEAEQLGDGWLECLHPDDRERLLDTWRQSVSAGNDYESDYRVRRHDGVYRWFKARARAVLDAGEHGKIWYGSSTDIDDLMRAETDLHQRSRDLEAARQQAENEKRRLEAVFDALPVGLAITDAHGGSLQTNDAYEQIWTGPGRAQRPEAGSVDDYAAFKAWWADSGAPVQPAEWASALAVQRGERVVGQMLEIQRFDGTRGVVINSAAPVRDAAGTITGSAVAIQDITALHQAEKQLLASEQKYRALFFGMNAAVALFEAVADDAGKIYDYTFLDLNPLYEELIGVSRDARMGRRALESFGFAPFIEHIAAAIGTGEIQKFEFTAEKTNKNLSASIVPVGGRLGAAIISDVTDQIKAQKEARDREQELKLIMDATPALLAYVDRDFRYRRVNRNYERWFNRKITEIQGFTIWEAISPEYWEIVRPNMELALLGQTVRAEVRIPADGKLRDVQTTYIPDIDVTGQVCGLIVQVVDLSDQKSMEFMLNEALERSVWLARFPGENPNPVARIDAGGRVLFCNDEASTASGWNLDIGAPLPVIFMDTVRLALEGNTTVRADVEAEGRVYSITARPFVQDGYVNLYGLDVTEARQAENALTSYAEQLQRSNRALEEFAFIASHDLQEPLRKIIAFGDLLMRRSGEQVDDHGRDYIARMQDAARRMQAMIDGLLTYSQVDTQGRALKPVDLSKTVREVLSDLEVRLETSRGRVEIGDLPVVEADELQMRQLLQNLIGNALKFHRPDVPPHVQVTAVELPGGWVELRVADNGIGIASKHQGELFQPFGRLNERSKYEGSGMGLAICRKIVERHGGTVYVESAPDEGAVFIVRLPCRQDKS